MAEEFKPVFEISDKQILLNRHNAAYKITSGKSPVKEFKFKYGQDDDEIVCGPVKDLKDVIINSGCPNGVFKTSKDMFAAKDYIYELGVIVSIASPDNVPDIDKTKFVKYQDDILDEIRKEAVKPLAMYVNVFAGDGLGKQIKPEQIDVTFYVDLDSAKAVKEYEIGDETKRVEKEDQEVPTMALCKIAYGIGLDDK